MSTDEHSSPTRKRDREEELADGDAAEKRPRADDSEGASLLGLANYEDEEEAARGHANGRQEEEKEEEDDAEEEEDVRRAPERRPRQVELRRDCPYLDTVNRQVLDFDFEKFCSISLSNLNVYACLVCGKYYQGRGLKSHAYTHSLEAGHHVFINLQTEKVYCLPDGYEINDPSLDDIRHVLNPRFTREQVLNLDKNKQWSRALDGSNYLPGMVGLNNIKETDFVNVTIQSLMRVTPLRNFFLIPENYQHSKSPLVHRLGELTRKIWHARNFKGQGNLEVVKEIHRKHIMEKKEDADEQNGEAEQVFEKRLPWGSSAFSPWKYGMESAHHVFNKFPPWRRNGFSPGNSGYEICLWCWHHIMEMDQKDECGGMPGFCSFYNKDSILGTGISSQILKELCPDKSNLQKEQTKSQKHKSAKSQLRVAKEPIDPNNARVIQRKLVYIVGMPSEFAKDKVLRQKNFLGQYGKIENIIIDNIGANQQIPDFGRIYVTFQGKRKLSGA